MFKLSLILGLALTGRVGLAATPAVNDNYVHVATCAEVLTRDRQIRPLEVRTLFTAGREGFIMRCHAAATQKREEGRHLEAAALRARAFGARHQFPVAGVTAGGEVVRVDATPTELVIRVARPGQPERLVRAGVADARERGGSLTAVSPDGRYVVLSVRGIGHLLLSTETGESLAKFAGPPNFDPEHDDEPAYRFSDDSRVLTVNNSGLVRVFRLTPPRAIEGKVHHLGDSSEWVGSPGSIHEQRINGMTSAHFLPAQNAFVAFYRGPRPLMISLGPNASFTAQPFAPSVGRRDVPERYLKARGPQYEDGLVSTDHDLAAVVSPYGGEFRIELFRLSTRKLIKTLRAGLIDSVLALSPDGRWLAAKVGHTDEIAIFKVKTSLVRPEAVIKLGFWGTDRIRYTSNHELALESAALGWVKSIRLPF